MLTQTRYHSCWEEALEQLYLAAKDSAEFAAGVPTGRSRTVSLRKLKAAVDHLEELERMRTSSLR